MRPGSPRSVSPGSIPRWPRGLVVLAAGRRRRLDERWPRSPRRCEHLTASPACASSETAPASSSASGRSSGDVGARVSRVGSSDEDALARSSTASIGRVRNGRVDRVRPRSDALRTGLTEAGGRRSRSSGRRDEDRVVSVHHCRRGRRDDRHVRLRRPWRVDSPESRRFIHDFQSRYGSPPGAFGAEGWDVGGMLLRVPAGATDRPRWPPPVDGRRTTVSRTRTGSTYAVSWTRLGGCPRVPGRRGAVGPVG